jgi:hypothetical protein
MAEKIDIYDGEPWTEIDLDVLKSALLLHGDTIEDAAECLGRLGTVDEVRRKAEELGLKYKTVAKQTKADRYRQPRHQASPGTTPSR